MRLLLALSLLIGPTTACGSSLPRKPPPLASMEEPLELQEVSVDPAARSALPLGTFSGLEVAAGGESLEELSGLREGAVPGLEVLSVVENSPADVAGLRAGDLLLAARLGGQERDLAWPSDWHGVELDAEPGDEVILVLDRAGVAMKTGLTLEQRVRPRSGPLVARYREEERVGVVVRTATEVEAYAAGLAPGAGAVVVGLARESPWRWAGVRFGDLIVRIDGQPVGHPAVVVDAARTGGRRLELELVRDGELRVVDAPLSERAQELQSLSIPLLLSYESGRGQSHLSVALGALSWNSTPVSWRLRLAWVIAVRGGDADRLREVDP